MNRRALSGARTLGGEKGRLVTKPAWRSAAAVVCMSLLAAACGTRLDVNARGRLAATRTEALSAGDDQPTATLADDPVAAGSVQAGAGGSTAAVSRGRAAGGTGGVAAGDNGGATDVGVTATEIRVGNVSAITGPLPSQFRPMAEAVQAYFKAVNDAGGINGRNLVLYGCDDEMNGQKRVGCLKSLVEDKKVFAFVGNLSAADENDAGYLDGQLKGVVPDVGGFALSYSRSSSASYWSPMGALRRELAGTGQWEFIKARTGFTKPMVFWHNIQISREQGQTLQKELATVLGISDENQIRSAEVSPTQPDFNLQVAQAKQNGIDAFFTSMEIASNIRLVRAVAQNRDASWNPTIHFELATYTADFIEALGPLAKGVYIRIPHTPFSEPSFPPMARYLSTLGKYFPHSTPASFGVFGWAGAGFFVRSLEKAGPKLTRAKLVEAMKSFTGPNAFTDGGLIGPNDNIRVQPFSCHVITQVTDEGGKLDFRRINGPGFVCSKTFKWRKAYGE